MVVAPGQPNRVRRQAAAFKATRILSHTKWKAFTTNLLARDGADGAEDTWPHTAWSQTFPETGLFLQDVSFPVGLCFLSVLSFLFLEGKLSGHTEWQLGTLGLSSVPWLEG